VKKTSIPYYLQTMNIFRRFSYILIGALIFSACKKETADFHSDPVQDYFLSLQPGKYILYNLDSMRFVNFGQADTLVHYQAKDVVDEAVTDNQGRPGWRIYRYIRDAQSVNDNDWQIAEAYMVVATKSAIEVIENNQRSLKLMAPINLNFTWRGNTYMPEKPFSYGYSFVNDTGIQFWDFSYSDVDQNAQINGKDYEHVITVTNISDSVNVPITEPEMLAYKSQWTEQYAKGVGLVYKEVILWDYQPPNGGSPGYKTGFGVTMSIIDHN
jgi:hypothetical protein